MTSCFVVLLLCSEYLISGHLNFQISTQIDLLFYHHLGTDTCGVGGGMHAFYLNGFHSVSFLNECGVLKITEFFF